MNCILTIDSVAVHLFSNRSQMMSKCGKRVAHNTLMSSVIYSCMDQQQHAIYLFYKVRKKELVMADQDVHMRLQTLKVSLRMLISYFYESQSCMCEQSRDIG